MNRCFRLRLRLHPHLDLQSEVRVRFLGGMI